VTDELPPGGVRADDPPWDAWHPREVAERLRNVATPWWVAAGWAIDLFRGEQIRPHEDLEIAVPRAGFAEHSGASRTSDREAGRASGGRCQGSAVAQRAECYSAYSGALNAGGNRTRLATIAATTATVPDAADDFHCVVVPGCAR